MFSVKIEEPNILAQKRTVDLVQLSEYVFIKSIAIGHKKDFEDLRNICDKNEKLIEVKYFSLGPYRVICEKIIIDEVSNKVNQEGTR